jgi:hypothetical protein
MRFKLLQRRLTVSAPRMAVRSTMPWPLRWAGAAMVLGLCAAMSLWTFEFGKSLTGLDSGTLEELARLRDEVTKLRQEQQSARWSSNASVSLLTAERTAQEHAAARMRALEAENRVLREDLGFFEKLIPTNGTGAVAIRALHAEVLDGAQLKWQVLLIQPMKGAREFRGRLEMSMSGTLDGKPWMMDLQGGAQPLQFRNYRRAEGMVDLPAQAVVKNVSAKVMEGTATRAVQSIAVQSLKL